MKNYMELLRCAKIFRGMEEKNILSMLDCLAAVKKRFTRGEFLYRAGEPAGMAALVLDGMFHIDREDYWGNNSILSDITAGELFGEVYAMLGREPVTINATAASSCTVMMMDINRVFMTCETTCPYHTRLIRNLTYVVASKNRTLTSKLGYLSQRTTRGKLMAYLSEQSVRCGSPSFDIPFNRQQMADFLSVDRSAMSKELGRLRDEGILDFNKNHFILKEKQQ